MEQRFFSPDYTRVADSLRDVGFSSAVELLGTYAGQTPDLAEWLEGASINRDRNLRLQYLAGMGLNLYRAEAIFSNMIVSGVGFPEGFFTGTPELIDELRGTILQRQGR